MALVAAWAGAPAVGAGPPVKLLREAREALEGVGPGSPELPARLQSLARADSRVADHAELLRVRLLARRGGLDEAIAAAEGALSRHRQSPLAADFARILGNLRLASGDLPGARDALRRAIALRSGAEERALSRVLLGAALEAEGRAREAAAQYRIVWIHLPAAPEGALAGLRLDALEAAAGLALRSARDHLARADTLFDERHMEGARVAYEEALHRGLPPAARRRAKHRRALALFHLRRYPEAAQAFHELGADAEARFWHARSVGRAGDRERAVALFESLGVTPGGVGLRARLFAALLLEEPEEAGRARAHLVAVARGAEGDLRRTALFELAWRALRTGDAREARRRFLELAGLADAAPGEVARARYWAARALDGAGGSPAEERSVRAELERVAREFPLDYHGWRAREWLRARGRPVGEAAAVPLETGEPRIPERALERLSILAEAGFREETRRETAGLLERRPSLADRVALARILFAAGEAGRALRLLLEGMGPALAAGPAPGQVELFRLAWPRVFEDVYRRSLPVPRRMPLALPWAVMREESHYRADAISTAGARGLMQIMPETGARLARELGWPRFDPADLDRPEVAIPLGAFYLERLVERFDGRLSAAVASYNAGPEAVERWLAQWGEEPDDLFVERIPYKQTRRYVRRVLGSLAAYELLYPELASR